MVHPLGERAPYTTAASVIGVIERFRHADTALPERFDKTTLIRLGVPESLAPRTLQALGLLHLINDEYRHTEDLQRFAEMRDDDKYLAHLREFIKIAYKPVIDLAGDPSVANDTDIANAFRKFEPRGQRDRMVALFVGLCEHSGLRSKHQRSKKAPVSTRIQPAKVVSPPRTRRQGRRKRPEQQTGDEGADELSLSQNDERQIKMELQVRYIELLLEKAAASEEPDTALLDRIEGAFQWLGNENPDGV